MIKQTALDYVEELLARAVKSYTDLEENYGEDLADFEPRRITGGNVDDAYELGAYHGATFRDLTILPEIIDLLKKERE